MPDIITAPSQQAIDFHSIQFDDVNTWDYWHLIPAKRPWVNPPKVKTTFIEVPGANDYLDFTEALSGTLNFGAREGEWEFYVANDYESWVSIYQKLLNTPYGIHGRTKTVKLLDDPMYSYEGRFEVEWDSSDKSNSKVKIKYKLKSHKVPTSEVGSRDWQWDELFGNTIYYGSFDVDGEKKRNLINQSGSALTLGANCSSAMEVLFDGTEVPVILPAGTSQILTIQPGNNPVTFTGRGRVKLTYDLVDIL